MAEERKRIADELMRAMADDQITPFFQPQVASRTRALVGVETLVRWARPDGGITDPSVFLPIAEDLGVMAEIDDIMLVKSFEMVRRMAALGLEIPKISVNVSYRRLADHQLARKLGRAADWPCRVAFELLETIDFDSNSDSLLWRIDEIRERGVEIELDDFGSGRASITTLHKIRPERIKIDRQLVGTVESDLMKESPILKAIGHIAKSMGISMVAEGVETETQVRVLQRIGCDILQGFLFSPALPEADLRRWMIERPDLRVSPGASAG
jgi:EAL domain-containing protein (putative c-di-GMP-specific phosphodiesterase class I)